MTEPFLDYSSEFVQGEPLAAALRVVDGFTLRELVGLFKFYVNGEPVVPQTNLSRFFLFYRFPFELNTIRILSRYYAPCEVVVPREPVDPLNPMVSVVLVPDVCYPFPARATLIRGCVADVMGEPVAHARVWIDLSLHTPLEARTDVDGEFVLFFTRLRPEDVVVDVGAGKRFIKDPAASPETLLRIHAQAGALTGFLDVDSVPEGETVVLPEAVVLSNV